MGGGGGSFSGFGQTIVLTTKSLGFGQNLWVLGQILGFWTTLKSNDKNNQFGGIKSGFVRQF